MGFGGKLLRKVERVSKKQYLWNGVGIQGKRNINKKIECTERRQGREVDGIEQG